MGRMQTVTRTTGDRIAALERRMKTLGLEHHLAAARRLVGAHMPAEKIHFMMRGMFSVKQIEALIAEAETAGTRR